MDAVGSNRSQGQIVRENWRDMWQRVKSNPYVNMFIPLEDFSEGNYLAAIPYMVSGGGGIKQVAKLPKFTFTDYMNQGKKRALRVINDAEYQEALYKVTKDPIALEAQRNGITLSKLATASDTKGFPSGTKLRTQRQFVKFPEISDKFLPIEEVKLRLKKAHNLKSDQELRNYLISQGVDPNILEKTSDIYKTNAFQSEVDAGKWLKDVIRSLFSHESHHAGIPIDVIQNNNSKFPIKLNEQVEPLLSPMLKDYYLDPDELRVRAMELRRLYQTTGKSYEELLNSWETTPHRENPNIDDLIKLYDRESLLKYLNGFLEDGGVINYLNYFSK